MLFAPANKHIIMKSVKNLKYIIFILWIGLSTSAIAQQKFAISGTVPGKDGQKVELVRYTEGSIQTLGVDTIKNEKFHISVPVDEISLALLQIDRKFGGTVVVEPATLKYTITGDGAFGTQGGQYTPLLNGFLKNKAFIAADDLFKKLTKGGNIAAIKGTKEEWEMIAPFLKKEDLRSSYLADLVKTNPDPKVKVMAAIMCELQPDAAKTMEIVNRVASQVGENTIMMKRIRSMEKQQAAALARRHEGMLGQQFTDFTAVNLKGESMNLAPVVKGNKYTLLQFWASWCGPCRKEIPLLKKIYAKYKSKGFEIVSFSMDENKYNWEKASEVEKMSWINVSDLRAFNSGVAKTYPIFGIPANVIIDQTGKIVASNLLDKDLENRIADLLK